MNRSLRAVLLAASLVTVLAPAVSRAENVQQEAVEHPRLVKAIEEMEDAVRYLEAAPHDFGGHKAAAIRDTRKAIEQLRKALRYRAVQDTRHGR